MGDGYTSVDYQIHVKIKAQKFIETLVNGFLYKKHSLISEVLALEQ